MVSFYNTFGEVSMTGEYFSELVARAVQTGFGVAGMAPGSVSDNLLSFVSPESHEKGVRVTEVDGKLIIDLHIKVTYGVNIAAAVKSVTHKVRYTVEEATGLLVRRINVAVDDVVG